MEGELPPPPPEGGTVVAIAAKELITCNPKPSSLSKNKIPPSGGGGAGANPITMKPGSLVQYTGAPKYRAPHINYPDPEAIYTVRRIKLNEDGVACLFVEELVMGYCQCGCNQELGSAVRNWREIQPPEEAKALLHDLLSNTLSTVPPKEKQPCGR